MIKISVVTPSFNQAKYLERTILSVLCQDYESLEYIVIDGGSADGSVEIIEKYSTKLHYWESQEDGGQSDALKRGFNLASGEVLCWVNSDDVLLPGALNHISQMFEANPGATVINGGGLVISSNDKFLRQGLWTLTNGVAASFNRLRFYGQDGVYQPSTFFRANAFRKAGGIDATLYFTMDLDLFIRLARERPFIKTNRLLSAWRVHSEAKSVNAEHIRVQEMALLRQRYVLSSEHGWNAWIKRLYFRMQSIGRKLVCAAPVRLGLINLPVEAREFA